MFPKKEIEMPPKSKFTKDEIVAAAVNVVRKNGITALTARALAAELGTSAKPIFNYFTGMDEVRDEVISSANALYESCIKSGMETGAYPPYKASGIAYIRFARDERELFKLLFMRDRTGESITEDRDSVRPLLRLIMQDLGISEDEAFLLHIELWLFVHGIATMQATAYLDWDIDFIENSLTDVYSGLKLRFTSERSKK